MSQEPTPERPRSNRRDSFRRTPKASAKVVCRKGGLDLGHNISVGALDLSQTGARLTAACELPKGQEVSLTLESVEQRWPLRIIGVAVWCRPEGDGWQIGVRFDKRLDYRAFLALTQGPCAMT